MRAERKACAAAENLGGRPSRRGLTAPTGVAQLVVNASHELRTPVASLRGHLDSLNNPDRKPRLDPEAREYVAIMAGEVRRLSALVDDVLSLARADAGELRLELRPIHAEEVARQVCETLAPASPARTEPRSSSATVGGGLCRPRPRRS